MPSSGIGNLLPFIGLARAAEQETDAAAIAAFGGAFVLRRLARFEPLGSWSLSDRTFEITPTGLVVGLLVVGFALAEFHRVDASTGFPPRFIPVGGLLSGLFGALSLSLVAPSVSAQTTGRLPLNIVVGDAAASTDAVTRRSSLR